MPALLLLGWLFWLLFWLIFFATVFFFSLDCLLTNTPSSKLVRQEAPPGSYKYPEVCMEVCSRMQKF